MTFQMTREEALQRKKTMATLEPSERVQYVKGVRRVKEWLASAYRFDRRDVRGGGSLGPWAYLGSQVAVHASQAPARKTCILLLAPQTSTAARHVTSGT